MPTAVIHFIFKNPVIKKYVIDPSEGLDSGQRSGSATGQHFWEMVGISVLLKDPMSVAGDYMGVLTQVLHLRAGSLLIPTTLLLY